MSPIKVKPGKDPQPPRPTTTTTTTPAPLAQPAKAGTPSGPITTAGFPGVTWEDVTRYDDAIHAAADPVGWPVERVRGHILIESQGKPRAMQNNASNGNSYGLMQVVPYGVGWEGWHKLVKEKAGLPANASKQQVIDALYDPAVNIAVGVTILEGFYQQYGRLDEASSAFFLGNPNWKGEDTVNGNTGSWYRDTLNALIKEQDANGTTPAVTTTPAPVPQGDVIDLLYGGKPYDISAGYGQLVTWSCPGCYDYQAAYGLDTKHHYAYDISARAGEGAPLYAPFDGLVVCAGTGVGSGAWGTGCAAFDRVNNYGSPRANGTGHGRIEILNEDGTASLIIGHALSARVRAGDRVKRGDLIGAEGGMNASHTHCESRYDNGRRIGDPRVLFGGGPMPTVYAERLPISQPDDDPPYWVVRVTADEVPVLQSGSAQAPKAAPPLKKGETFFATYRLPGTDGKGYWVSTKLGRVPISGTEEVEVVLP